MSCHGYTEVLFLAHRRPGQNKEHICGVAAVIVNLKIEGVNGEKYETQDVLVRIFISPASAAKSSRPHRQHRMDRQYTQTGSQEQHHPS